MKFRAGIFLLLALLLAHPSFAGPVLMISIDGMKPEYVLQADAHGLRIPTLRAFVRKGSYAEGVVGVVPTVTYPSHTTLVTGVWPSEHGIDANVTFDPLLTVESWNWYAQDIKVPTLWDAAAKAGISTASVSWPVTVGANIKYLIPEYWRTKTANDDKLMAAISKPDGMFAKIEERLGPYNGSPDGGIEGDKTRAEFANEILKEYKPGFMLVHLAALDHVEHGTGPFSTESDETLEETDGMVAGLMRTALENDPGAVIAIVSDHGFVPVDHRVKLLLPFIAQGLIRIKPATANAPASIASWDTMLWAAGGSAGVMLRDPKDEILKARVKTLLEKLASEPTYSVARVIGQPELTRMGGFPDASFLIEMKPGAELGTALQGPLVQAAPGTGTHGYLPDRPALRASFFIMGKGIAAGRDLGVIDMRQIAPTIAGILGVQLPDAKEPKLNIRQ